MCWGGIWCGMVCCRQREGGIGGKGREGEERERGKGKCLASQDINKRDGDKMEREAKNKS